MSASDCVGGEGYKRGEKLRADAVRQASLIRGATAAIIAVDNAMQVIDNYSRQRDLANRTTKMAEEQQKHMEETYWPRELEFLNEFANPEEREEVEVLGRRISGRLVSQVANAFAKKEAEIRCNASRYCASGYAKAMQDLFLNRSFAIAQARTLGRNIAFAKWQQYEGLDDSRRREAIALGKGLVGSSASLMKQAGQGLANAGSNAAAGLNNALAGLGAALAYRGPSPMEFYSRNIYNAPITETQQSYAPGYSQAPFSAPTGAFASPANTFGIESSFSDFNGVNTASQVVTQGPPPDLEIRSVSNFSNRQSEMHHEAAVGNQDRARVGEHTYTWRDSRGDTNQLTIKMSDFELGFVDDKQPGES